MSRMTKEEREAVRERLAEIESTNGGRLTPDAVVADAKNPDSPLHKHFEWDVQRAAEKHWIEQARELITVVMVDVRTEKTTVSVNYYSRDPTAKSDEQGYVSIETLRSDEDMAREAVVNEFSYAAAALRRARNMAAVLKIEERVDDILERITTTRTAVIEMQQAAS